MSKTENFAKPANSHLVLFDQPKVATVKGYIERVFGLIISQHVDGYGHIITNRTVLCDEELNSTWNINDNEDDSLDNLYYFKNFPNLSMEDISRVIRQTDGTRDITDSFNDLVKLGAIVPAFDAPLEMCISENDNEYSTWGRELCHISLHKAWIPCALEKLYGIQRFLNRPIKLVIPQKTEFAQETLDFMQELLNNQFKNGVYVDGYYSGKETFVNDGEYTYNTNGTKVAMTREEFLSKHPDAFEL